jgi:hypothetical protein
MAKVDRGETVRKVLQAPVAQHYRAPRAPFSARLARLMMLGSAFGVSLGTLFGQSRKGNSANFAVTEFYEVRYPQATSKQHQNTSF